MKRVFWLGVGVAAGVALSRRAGQMARQVTPAGIADNISEAISELAGALGAFGADIRAGMVERERELTDDVVQRTGINPTPRAALAAAEQTLRASATPARRPGRARRANG